jgi:hypothetical protein
VALHLREQPGEEAFDGLPARRLRAWGLGFLGVGHCDRVGRGCGHEEKDCAACCAGAIHLEIL